MPIKPKKLNPIYQAQAILARRDHSEAEVRMKLARKGFAAQQIEEAIAFLRENNLLNDHALARRYAASILSSKPVGPAWLAAKLRAKGVPASAADEAVAWALPAGREEELAREAAVRWRATHAKRAGDRAALYRFLTSRGFSPDAISQALANA